MNEPYLYALVSIYVPEHFSSLTQLAGGLFIKEIRDGNTYANGVLHSFNDQPAVIGHDGAQFWYQHGQLHRDHDLPAIVGLDGYQAWCQHGQGHRDNDKPVLILVDGSQWIWKRVLCRVVM